jgi:hypothetical protein
MKKEEILNNLQSELNSLADKFGEYIQVRMSDKTIELDSEFEEPEFEEPEFEEPEELEHDELSPSEED